MKAEREPVNAWEIQDARFRQAGMTRALRMPPTTCTLYALPHLYCLAKAHLVTQDAAGALCVQLPEPLQNMGRRQVLC